MRKFLKFYSLPLLSAFLMGTSYIPFPPWALFFCYVPLWIFALKQKKLKPLLIGAFLCQFVATLIGFNWVAYTIREFGFFPWPLAILGLLAFASFTNLHIPIALFFWFISQKKINELKSGRSFPWFTLLLLPLYFALCMEYYPMIFEWNFGYAWLYAKWSAAQTAQIWGFKFLNTLTLFFNLFFLSFYLKLALKEPKNKFLGLFRLNIQDSSVKVRLTSIFTALPSLIRLVGAWVLLFTGLNFYGYYLKTKWPEPDKKAHVLLVQPNIENLTTAYKKSGKDPRPLALSQLIKETKKYFSNENDPSPDFILWPEGAYPYRVQYDGQKARESFVQKQARKWESPIVMSAIGESAKGTTNSIFVFNEKGDLVQSPYDKTLLLAFGEYLPGEKWLPLGKWLSYYGRSFQRGTGESKVTKLNEINLGFQICYEGLFDFFTRDLSRKKAHILVNVTNDSWYGSWQQPWQHLYMTLARAIEVRRPLVRGTNTGLSSFISAKGEIDKISTLNKNTSWIQEIPYYSEERQSVFSLWGYYINQCFLWVLFFLCLGYFFLFSGPPPLREGRTSREERDQGRNEGESGGKRE